MRPDARSGHELNQLVFYILSLRGSVYVKHINIQCGIKWQNLRGSWCISCILAKSDKISDILKRGYTQGHNIPDAWFSVFGLST